MIGEREEHCRHIAVRNCCGLIITKVSRANLPQNNRGTSFLGLVCGAFNTDHDPRIAAGHSQERYMRRMVAEMRGHGWLVVVYNRRGHSVGNGGRSAVAASVRERKSELEMELPEGRERYAVAKARQSSPRAGEAVAVMRGSSGGENVVVIKPVTTGLGGEVEKQMRVWPLYSDVDDMDTVLAHTPFY
jgi:hypothetical protein